MKVQPVVRICFVCLGNICRSPTAEAVMRQRIQQAGLSECIVVDSAGTSGHHEGERADPRSLLAARRRGVEITSIARQTKISDFEDFDYLVAMDSDNHRDLLALAPNPRDAQKVHLLRFFDPESPNDASVPDPYYLTGHDGFEEVLNICERACDGLLKHLQSHHGL